MNATITATTTSSRISPTRTAVMTQGTGHAPLELRWRNELARRLGLRPDGLQAVVGDADLGTGADRTWRYFDSRVTGSPTRAAATTPGFAADYAAVIGNLLPQTGVGLRRLLWDRIGSWQAFRSDPANLPVHLPTLASGAIDVTAVLVQMFQSWAIGQLEPCDLRAAIDELRGTADPVCGGTAALAAAAGRYGWATDDAPHTPASARPLTVRCVAGAVAVHARFDNVWRIDGRPSTWFDPSALALAHDHDTPTVWRRRSPTWAGTFGPDGTLRRVVTGLIVADGVEVTVAQRRRGQCCRACSAVDRGHGLIWSSGRGRPRVIGLVTEPIEKLLPSATN